MQVINVCRRPGQFALFTSTRRPQMCGSLRSRSPLRKTSVFRTESVAMKHEMECLQWLQYQLHTMGGAATLARAANIVFAVHPSSTMMPKTCWNYSMCYHAFCETVVMGACLPGQCLHAWTPRQMHSVYSRSTEMPPFSGSYPPAQYRWSHQMLTEVLRVNVGFPSCSALWPPTFERNYTPVMPHY